MSEGAEIEHRHLRSAIEYAVLMAEETQRRKPPMAVPNELRPFFGKHRVPSGALGRLRRSIEADDLFRRRIAAGALPELVDDVGRLWLQRPDGWVDDALAAIRAVEAERASWTARPRCAGPRSDVSPPRSRRCGHAWKECAFRRSSTNSAAELDRLVADLEKADDALTEMRAELIDVRNEARHARDREAAAAAKLERALAASAASASAPRSAADASAQDGAAIAAETLAALQAEIDAELGEMRAGLTRSTASIEAAMSRAAAAVARTEVDPAGGSTASRRCVARVGRCACRAASWPRRPRLPPTSCGPERSC